MVAAVAAAVAWALYTRERRARVTAENRALVESRLSASLEATRAVSVAIALDRRRALRRIERELAAKRELAAAERRRIEDRITAINATDDVDELARLMNEG